jgi:hypothetical protein
MAVARLKITAALLLATVLLATGLMIRRAVSAPAPEMAQAQPAPVVGIPPGAGQDEADAPIEVNGRVLEPKGRPIAGAKLYVGFSAPGRVPDVRPMAYPLRTTSAADGRFHFTFTQSELDAASLDHSRPAVIAVAQGYGTVWADIKEWTARGHSHRRTCS